MRLDNRSDHEPRPVQVIHQYTKYALGSVLIAFGDTKVLCSANIEERVPPFLRDSNQGWLTAEYALLPSATHTRSPREVNKGKQTGRSQEIQRLIGRSLRAVLDLQAIPNCTIQLDADVLQADGGTRTAAITGCMLALHDAVTIALKKGIIANSPIKEWLGAISVGVYNNQVICDLTYEEDSSADVDMNLVMTESGRFVEIQGTAEKSPFNSEQLSEMIALGKSAILSHLESIKPPYV